MDLCFIVAAPRSGTKILRDTLNTHPQIEATQTPWEELWSTGMEEAPDDEFDPDQLSDDVRDRIRGEFEQTAHDHKIFIEKNVRHSLRIPYVKAVFPEARFIHIIRDARDEVTSNVEHKKNPIDWSYYLSSKALEISPVDMVKYSARLGWKTLKRLFGGSDEVAIWGPRFEGFQEAIRNHSPLEISARQWNRCVGKAHRDGGELGGEQYVECHYEELMTSPEEVLPGLADFLGLEDAEPMVKFGRREFRTDRIGRWKSELTEDQLDTVESITGELMAELGYQLERRLDDHRVSDND